MNRTILTLALACQLAASAALAQTESTAGTSATDAMSQSYGSDWSLSLGPALFGEDGKTLRADSEITSQWKTLSDEDQAMLRRDCLAHSQQAGAASDSMTGDTAKTGTTDGAAVGSATTDSTTGDAGMSDAGSPMMVSREQMERICASVKGL